MTELKQCPTPWCDCTTIHTTTYHKSKKLEDGTVTSYTEVSHSCIRCGVRTPQLSRANANKLWNDRTAAPAEMSRIER